ncbi:DUF2752 domain-containing protein, partial [Sphaerisporangium aureirubrum]
AVHALTRGDVGAAVGFNPLLVVMIPLLLLWWGDWVVRAWRGRGMRVPRLGGVWIWGFLALLIVYWVVRNLPFAAFLAP